MSQTVQCTNEATRNDKLTVNKWCSLQKYDNYTLYVEKMCLMIFSKLSKSSEKTSTHSLRLSELNAVCERIFVQMSSWIVAFPINNIFNVSHNLHIWLENNMKVSPVSSVIKFHICLICNVKQFISVLSNLTFLGYFTSRYYNTFLYTARKNRWLTDSLTVIRLANHWNRLGNIITMFRET